MAVIVNLKTARKRREKARDRSKAAENAVRFGQTKAERSLDDDAARRADRHLDGHRREEPEG